MLMLLKQRRLCCVFLITPAYVKRTFASTICASSSCPLASTATAMNTGGIAPLKTNRSN